MREGEREGGRERGRERLKKGVRVSERGRGREGESEKEGERGRESHITVRVIDEITLKCWQKKKVLIQLGEMSIIQMKWTRQSLESVCVQESDGERKKERGVREDVKDRAG